MGLCPFPRLPCPHGPWLSVWVPCGVSSPCLLQDGGFRAQSLKGQLEGHQGLGQLTGPGRGLGLAARSRSLRQWGAHSESGQGGYKGHGLGVGAQWGLMSSLGAWVGQRMLPGGGESSSGSRTAGTWGLPKEGASCGLPGLLRQGAGGWRPIWPCCWASWLGRISLFIRS